MSTSNFERGERVSYDGDDALVINVYPQEDEVELDIGGGEHVVVGSHLVYPKVVYLVQLEDTPSQRRIIMSSPDTPLNLIDESQILTGWEDQEILWELTDAGHTIVPIRRVEEYKRRELIDSIRGFASNVVSGRVDKKLEDMDEDLLKTIESFMAHLT